MSEQENIKIVRNIFDLMNAHKFDEADRYLAEDIRVDRPGIPNPMNKENYRTFMRNTLEAFPDLHYDLKDIVAQGDKVVTRWVMRGTHKGPWTAPSGDRIPATQRTIVLPCCSMVDLRNNKVTRGDFYWDELGFLSQLGLVNLQELTSRLSR